MKTYKPYRVLVKHDDGKCWLRLIADSTDGAKSLVMAVEGCPMSAILDVEEIDIKQIEVK